MVYLIVTYGGADFDYVPDSLTELEDYIDTKRVPVGNLKFKDSSFHAAPVKQKPLKTQSLVSNREGLGPAPKSVSEKTGKMDSKVPVVSKIKKVGGLNHMAQTYNTEDIRLDLAGAFDNNIKKTNDKNGENKQSTESYAKEVECPKRPRRAVREIRKTVVQQCTDTESDDSEDSKKIKIDPDFTPKKYEHLKSDYKIVSAERERLTGRCMSLRKNCDALFLEKQQLEEKVKSLEEQLKKSSQMDCIASEKSSEESWGQVYTAHECVDAILQDFDDTDDDIGINGNWNTEKENELDEKKINKDKSTKLAEVKKTQILNEDKSEKLAEVKKTQEGKTQEKAEMMNVNEGKKEAGNEKMDTSSDIQVMIDDILPSDRFTMSHSVKIVLSKIKGGHKSDLRFIKDVAIVAFGPEVLASSTIFGTAKGGRKKTADSDTASKEKKPALNKDTLEAVQEALKRRVAKEENISLELAAAHSRVDRKRFYEAVRGAQKRCRLQGYGMGTKSNEASEDLLKE